MAATRLHFGSTGVMIEASQGNLTDKEMMAWIERVNNVEIQMEPLFDEITSTSATYKLTTWSSILGLPIRDTDTQALKFTEATPGYTKEFTIPEYRIATRIARDITETDRSGKHMQIIMAGLPKTGRRFIELLLADVFNTGTATAGADGSYIWANDHYHPGYSRVWSNVETGAVFSSSSVNAMNVSMGSRTNEIGVWDGMSCDEIIYPVALRETVNSYLSTHQFYDSALHGENPTNKGMRHREIGYLTSTTAWYGRSDSIPKESSGLHYIVLAAPNIRNLGYPSSEYPDIVAGWRLRMRLTAGASVVPGIHRNAGAAS